MGILRRQRGQLLADNVNQKLQRIARNRTHHLPQQHDNAGRHVGQTL